MRLQCIFLLFLTVNLCNAMFEYICEEVQLYKPYVHIYQGIKGDRLETWNEPGFYNVEFTQSNIYVCINGPAYLYYAKSTALGQVFEAPQFRVYSHTCEMHNVKPKLSATFQNYTLHLKAVLLIGDKDDYRRPYVQRFTAPYYFDKDKYKEGFPAHYQNATSVVIIGREQCTLEKGTQDPYTPIVIKPVFPPTSLPQPITPGPTVPVPEVDEYVCKRGFSELFTKAEDTRPPLTPPGGTPGPPRAPTEDELKMWAMYNDEPFGNKGDHCDSNYLVEPQLPELQTRKEKMEEACNKMRDHEWKSFDDNIVKLIAAVRDKIDKFPIPPPPLSPADEKKKKTLEEQETFEKKVKEDMDNLMKDIKQFSSPHVPNECTDVVAAPPDVTATHTAVKTAQDALKTALDELANEKDVSKILERKGAVYNAKRELEAANNAFKKEVSDYLKLVSDKEVAIANVQRALKDYKPWPAKGRSGKKLKYGSKATGVTIEIEHIPPAAGGTPPTAPSPCELLPKLSEECKKGKPEPMQSCDLFKIVMGKMQVWQDTSAVDYWKKDVLTMVSDIFVNACPYLGNRRKFVKLINLLMGHYITSEKHFNKPAAEGQSMACQQFKKWKGDQFTPPELPKPPQTNPAAPPSNENKEERPFWTTLKEILQKCKEEDRKLIFKDSSLTYGAWKWVPPNATKESEFIEIKPYQEQAEEEYVFNWVIDMAWRIFATTLGICMPGYENKNPLISSRFHSLFTEDFLIPLRETWINAKDNLVFQWILGEFYNGEAEHWTTLCMEASYMYAKREDYRPLRSLLVNCAIEHNYFTTGPMKGATGRFVSKKLRKRKHK